MKTRTLWLVGLLFVQALGAASFKISELPEATASASTNLGVLVASDGQTSKITLANLVGGRPEGFLLSKVATLTNIWALNLSATTNDVWTVPSGQRAYLSRVTFGSTNTATEAILVKTNGNYFRISSTATVTSGTPSGQSYAFVAEQGEAFAIEAADTGIVAIFSIFYYPNTVPLYSPRVFGLAVGDNTIYTVPTGKLASNIGISNPTITAVCTGYYNRSGGARAVALHLVPNGSSVSANTRFYNNAALADNNIVSSLIFHSLNPGDSFVVNTDSAVGQHAWATVFEWQP